MRIMWLGREVDVACLPPLLGPLIVQAVNKAIDQIQFKVFKVSKCLIAKFTFR